MNEFGEPIAVEIRVEAKNPFSAHNWHQGPLSDALRNNRSAMLRGACNDWLIVGICKDDDEAGKLTVKLLRELGKVHGLTENQIVQKIKGLPVKR